MVENNAIGYRLYGFGADEEELARTYQYHIIHSGSYSLVYDRSRPAGAAEIREEMLPLLTSEDKEWLAETIRDIVSKVEASVAYNERTNKYTEFVNRLREELEAERRKLNEEQNE